MNIAFLWHMHQPYYKNPLTDTFIMPWTFLHLIKDYYDMIKVVEEFENVKVTFNFVPSLIEQIQGYEETLDNDFFIKILKKPVESLNDNDKKSLLRQLFLANYENMIFPFKRYKELFDKKQDYKNSIEKAFSNDELLDLEVLYLLTWTGYFIREESEIVKNLIDKGKNYSENDKIILLDELQTFIKKVIPEYKNLYNQGKIEISSSPYFHPILPLLIDINIAKVAMPDVNIPFRINNFYEDAEKQVALAIEKFKDTFNIEPKGFWPSEGSVSTDTLDLFGKFNVKWIATDEDILFKSKENLSKKDLYRGYDYNGVKVFFRDKDLSNLIGFIYSKWNYEDAANDLYNRIKNIQKLVNDENAILSIILDGENAWEFYKNNGIPFLRKVYSLIENDNTLKFVTFSEYIENNSDFPSLSYIFPGSWINANFGIWIGHPEENKAWEFLDIAKTFLNQYKDKKEFQDKYELAEKELLIAEGSDWFWWYGDDFYSEMSDKFDSLFRTHLSNIFTIFNEDIPIEFLTPIKLLKEPSFITEPVDVISPVIDGKITNYFEWISAGEINFIQDTSTMHFSRGYLSKVFYGFDEENLFLRIDFGINLKEIENCTLEFNIHNKDIFKFKFYIDNNKIELLKRNNGDYENLDLEIEAAYEKIAEFKIPIFKLGIQKGDEINIYFSLFKNNEMLERAPFDSTIKIKIPENIFLDYWKV